MTNQREDRRPADRREFPARRDWERGTHPVDGAQFDRYVRDLHAAVEELLMRYGHVGVLSFDGEWENTWTRELALACEFDAPVRVS